jgi:hypothetical protein
MKLAKGSSALRILALWSLSGFAHVQAADVIVVRPTFIEFQPDGKTCKVRDVAVDCTKVVLHLRQVLKLPPGAEVRFRAGPNVEAFPVIKRVMDEVQRSEYTTVLAYITPPKSERMR